MAKGNSTYNISVKLNSSQFEKAAAKLGKNIINVGNTIKFTFARMVSNSLQQAFSNMISIGKDFENQMARVKAVSNANGAGFAMMEKEARKMGATTKYTASEAAEALEYLTRNGLSASQATNILSSVMKFAGANAISLSESANTLTNVLNMYNLTTKDAIKVSDVLSQAAARSATNVTELYEAFVNVGPAADSLGLSVEDTTAALMTLANKGVKGADAGSKLAQAFSKMLNPKIQKDLRDLGININSNTIKSKGLIAVLEQFKEAGLAPENLVKVFGERSWRGINTLIKSLDDLKKNLELTGVAGGTTFRMFEEGIGTIEKSTKELKSVFEDSVLSIFEKIKPVIYACSEALKSLISIFGNLGSIIGIVAARSISKFISASIASNDILKDNIKLNNTNIAINKALTKANGANTKVIANQIKYLTAVSKAKNNSAAAAAKAAKAVKLLTIAEKELKDTGKLTAATQKKLNMMIANTATTAAAATVSTSKFAGASVVLSKAWIGLKNVGKGLFRFLGGVPGIIITVLSLLGPLLNKFLAAKKELKNITKVDKEASNQVVDDIAKINKLHAIVSNNNISYETRIKALNQLKSICKDYNGQLSKEGKLTNDNTKALENHKKALIADAKAKILASKAAELEIKLQDQEAEYAVHEAERKAKKSNAIDRTLSTMANDAAEEAGMPQATTPSTFTAARMSSASKKELAQIDETRKALEKVYAQMNTSLEEYVSTGVKLEDDYTSNIETELSDREKAWKKYANAIEDIKSMETAKAYSPDNELENTAIALKKRINATESLISSIENLDKKNDKDRQSLIELQRELYKLQTAYDSYKDTIKETKSETVDQIKTINEIANAAEKYRIELTKLKQKDNPWDNFSPKFDSFREEKKILSDLENQLKLLQNALAKFDTTTIDNLNDALKSTDETTASAAAESLQWYKQLGIEIPKVLQQINEAKNNLNDKQASLLIKDTKRDVLKGRYEEIRNTTLAVSSLVSTFDELRNMNWDEMTGAEKFEKLSSVIFGTIDTVLSVIETFRTVAQLVKDLKVAEETYAAAKLATAGATLAANTEETSSTVSAVTTQATAVVAANAAMTKAYQVTAAAAATAANAALGLPGVATAAAQIAAMQALVAGAAILPRFSEGGIVKNGNPHGDTTLARLNNGEMVLNTAQQVKLFNALSSKTENSNGNKTVEFILKGKDLVASINNYNKMIKPTVSTL